MPARRWRGAQQENRNDQTRSRKREHPLPIPTRQLVNTSVARHWAMTSSATASWIAAELEGISPWGVAYRAVPLTTNGQLIFGDEYRGHRWSGFQNGMRHSAPGGVSSRSHWTPLPSTGQVELLRVYVIVDNHHGLACCIEIRSLNCKLLLSHGRVHLQASRW